MKLSEVQNRLRTDLGINLTYMEVRLLADDLKVTPRDVDPPKAPPTLTPGPTPPPGTPAPEEPAAKAGVSVSVDRLTRPGALVSGKVTFSDGQTSDWWLDQTGRLGLVPKQAGYRPTPPDVQQFQMLLEAELSKVGF
jgi:hypothetical protein